MIAGLNTPTKGCPEKLDRSRKRLHPRDNQSHCVVHPRGIDDEAPLFDQIESELSKPIAIVVALKCIAKNPPEPGIASRGRVGRSMRQAQVHHLADVQIE